MTIGHDTIEVYRGQDAQLNFTMTPAQSIAGWVMSMNIEGATEAECHRDLPVTILDGPNGTFRVTLTDEQTNLRVGLYHYDVWRTDDGSERPVAVGTLVVLDPARLI